MKSMIDTGVMALAAFAILVLGMRLHQADLTIPLSYRGDALLILPFVKGQQEFGTHWENPRLGAPDGQAIYDFPVIDTLHFALLRILGVFISDHFALYNIYYLLTYPLAAMTSYSVNRQLGLSRIASFCGAILFTFLPYHLGRGLGHYFLSAYYIVPLTILLAHRIAVGPPVRSWRSVLAFLILSVLTSLAGAYYAFFGCAILALAGIYRTVAFRTPRGLVEAGAAIGIVVLVGLIQHLPTHFYQSQYGKNSAPHSRTAEEAEEYPLKFTQLVMPMQGHNSPILSNIQRVYDSPFRLQQNENRTTALGMIGSFGLIALAAIALARPAAVKDLHPFSIFALACLAVGMAGGIGSLFAYFVTPQVRAYNRIAIYLAFFALFASCRIVDLAMNRYERLRIPAFLLLTAFGLWDQTGNQWFRKGIVESRDRIAEQFRHDRSFFTSLESTHPGALVFCLPFIAYPETYRCEQLNGYDHARGYLHTRTVRWSFGAMKGREGDQWQREVVLRPTPDMLDGIVASGFDVLFFDLRGYDAKHGPALLAEIRKHLGADSPLAEHPDGQQFLFDLRGYRNRRGAELGTRFDDLVRREAETVRFLWLDGFESFQKPGEEWKHHWCRKRGQMMIVNPSSKAVRIEINAIFRTETHLAATLTIDGEIWRETIPIDRTTDRSSRTLTVPPDRHEVRFHCTMPDDYVPLDSRRFVFFVGEFRTRILEE